MNITSFLYVMTMALLAITDGLFAQVHDLQKMKQNFVLETKQIVIPGYPDAFNPSIIRWHGRLLMSFRYRDPTRLETSLTDSIALVWLNDDFNPISNPYTLTHYKLPNQGTCAQDPRLIVVKNKIYMVYSDDFDHTNGNRVHRMIIAEVMVHIDGFSVLNSEPIFAFEGEHPEKREKNWVPFIYQNHLFLAYSLQPHLILGASEQAGVYDTYAKTHANIKWDWGVLRGGTTGQMVDGKYLAFFHSVKALTTVQSNSELMTHYLMGAYTFEPDPPFAINGFSPKPIVGDGFYEGPMYKTWKPLRVVFPCGFIFDEEFIWVTYGRQDHEMWVVKMNKAGLLKSLKPVTTME